jgi:hypothetical protein
MMRLWAVATGLRFAFALMVIVLTTGWPAGEVL